MYSYSTTKVGDMLAKLKKNVDCFEDIQSLSDDDVVNLVRLHDLDIAIDLKGYTRQSRSELFKVYLAPVQINWLGYPGTMGCEYIHYILADDIVIPEEQQKNYSEKVIYLPDCYQPNDDQRKISPVVKPRIDYGLPADAFVFCCFNQSYKISPLELNIWARVLQRIDHGVLWLLDSNRWAKDNLKKEIVARGVSADRIVFAKSLPHDKHLARLQLAHLTLDTFNVNAHTTASDSLWAGVPLVTKVGQQFAGRVAASLLQAIRMPELITETEQNYEKLIIEIALDSER